MVRLKEVETRKKEENPLLSCAQTYIIGHPLSHQCLFGI
ncbi:hypothetical protein Golob_020741 [Gossypium lobatum]|uniref:Uncharacterized protein n=1 Tax=Gossypium lobatum TaxID=34289 RepID=A0A7J8LB94_9ROSI|nr:hypothetical protein [Gossypium lobatum]